jgi:hypothetical protein
VITHSQKNQKNKSEGPLHNNESAAGAPLQTSPGRQSLNKAGLDGFSFSNLPVHSSFGATQTKLTVNTPGDKYEQEADATADKIMQMPENSIQRSGAEKGNEAKEEKGQRKALSNNISHVVQYKTEDGAVAGPSLTNKINSSKGEGHSMDKNTESFMTNRFGADLSKVKIHSNNQATQMNQEVNARAFTSGNDIYFNQGEYRPGTKEGKHLLSHELTHVLQQNSPGIGGRLTGSALLQRTPLPPSYGTKTAVLDESKVVIDTIPYFRMNQLAAPRQVNVQINDPAITHLTWELFDPADKMMPGSFSTLPGKTSSISKPFTLSPSDFSGTGLPEGKFILRCSGLNASHEPLFYADREFYVYSSSFSLGSTKGLAADPSRPSIPAIPPSSVQGYYFPGTSQERALVIGGVHGSEQSGIEVVEALKKLLENPSLPLPYFSTILIPVLFPDNYAYDKEYRTAHPKLQGTDLGPQKGGRYTRLGTKPEDLREPNRNYPTPGTSMETALKEDASTGGRPTSVPPPTGTTKVNQPLLPETQMLLTLIQKFRPSRIASVHSHRPSTKQGDAPGIFVDPRKDDPKTVVNETTQDDTLAKKMLVDAKKRGLTGSNPKDDVHYAASHPIGASLGDWAPAPVDEGTIGVNDQPGDRPGITTITVEVEGYSPASEDKSMASKIKIHSETLLEIFLARP